MLQDSLEALNDAFNRVPGLPQALQTGAQITQAQAQSIADEWTKANDSGIKMAFGALLDEYTGKLFSSVRDGVVTQLVQATVDDPIVKKFTRLLDPVRLANLKGVRGANPSFNKVMYWIHISERDGLDTTALLKDVLARHNISGAGADLIIRNLQDSYRLGKQLDAFTEDNVRRLRSGRSAQMGSLMKDTGYLQVGHIIDANSVPEMGKTFVNLKWEWSGIGSAYKDDLKQPAVNYARQMFDAGLIDRATWNKVQAEAVKRVAPYNILR